MVDSFTDFWKLKKRGESISRRSKEKIKRAIKENLKELISDSSIISSDGKKKIKIPIRQIDNYHFKHSDNKNKEGSGQGNKDGKPGDILGNDGSGNPKGQGGRAGDQAGEEIYEEITTEELIEMMMEDLCLPWLEQKEAPEIETDEFKFTSISETGPLSNVDKKRTIYQNMKRNAKLGKAQIHGVCPDDMRYKIWEPVMEPHSNAAVYCLMDRSGSMSDDKKYLASALYWYLVHFCKVKYKTVELCFIAHDTEAKVVPEENFFKVVASGGTKCSSAFQLALEHIKEFHPPEVYNNYVVEVSDGDSWNDAKECSELVTKLLEVCTAVGYCEVDLREETGFAWSTLHEEFARSIDHPKFLSYVLHKKEDLYECLKQFLKVRDE